MTDSLRINEIFYSLQGEALNVGLPTVFVRLTGCPLRCSYCDTEYAFHKGERLSFNDILSQIKNYKTNYITITGGEPLAQPSCLKLMTELCEQNYQVSLETSGALTIEHVDKRVIIVMDLKTPSSNEVTRNLYSNLQYLKPQDQIKFVIGDANDYDWCKQIINAHQLNEKCELLFSPAYKTMAYNELAAWILRDQLAVRMQVQLHKIIWGDRPGV